MIFKAHQFSLPFSTATKLIKLLFEDDLFTGASSQSWLKNTASQQPARAHVYDEDYLHLLNRFRSEPRSGLVKRLMSRLLLATLLCTTGFRCTLSILTSFRWSAARGFRAHQPK